MGRVLRSDWSGVMEFVECFLDISWNGDVQYDGLVVPFQCNVTVKTSCPILCCHIFYWSEFMRFWVSSILWYMIPN